LCMRRERRSRRCNPFSLQEAVLTVPVTRVDAGTFEQLPKSEGNALGMEHGQAWNTFVARAF
jgi:hypothetical protein